MQRSALITYFPSPSLIASTGQSAAQAPHEMHASPIEYAIRNTSFNYFVTYSEYIITEKIFWDNNFLLINPIIFYMWCIIVSQRRKGE
jgi:hypothetical protein